MPYDETGRWIDPWIRDMEREADNRARVLRARPKEVRIAEKRAEIQRLTAAIAQLEHDIAMIRAGVL